METAAAPAGKTLKAGAISYISGVVIAVASTAPGYSLAATLGFIVAIAGIGVQAPAVILVAFIPMACIAAAYNYMNRADPDCGTTFSWVTLSLGPRIGWFSGWAVLVADILVMPSLSQIAGIYSCSLVGVDHPSTLTVTIIGVIWIILMTAICYIGIELSARTQQLLLGMEIVTLALFAAVALVKVYTQSPAHSIKPQFSWFNPFAISSLSALSGGVLLAIFIYWGWDSAVSVNEETEDGATSSGKAAVVSTFILLGIYVTVAAGAQAFGGTQSLIANQTDVFAPISKAVLGSPLDKLLIIAVLTSASASTQTTILPATRTSLSMARKGALGPRFAQIHDRYLTPSFSTIWMGVVSIAVFVFLSATSENLIADAFTSLSMTIAFYYGITGVACAWFYRRYLTASVKNFIYLAFLPLLGAVILAAVFLKATVEYAAKDGGYAKPFLGIGSPVAITIAMILIGLVWFIYRYTQDRAFFALKPRPVDPQVAATITHRVPKKEKAA
ncbi:APC family permease [Conexibacter woesei]|uniref:APC family permease n=1 Tax=Conexibacter woesei TaxID=191495 RepID=UPI0003FF506D|nr:APC family permease [Conexibacter woesei]